MILGFTYLQIALSWIFVGIFARILFGWVDRDRVTIGSFLIAIFFGYFTMAMFLVCLLFYICEQIPGWLSIAVLDFKKIRPYKD